MGGMLGVAGVVGVVGMSVGGWGWEREGLVVVVWCCCWRLGRRGLPPVAASATDLTVGAMLVAPPAWAQPEVPPAPTTHG